MFQSIQLKNTLKLARSLSLLWAIILLTLPARAHPPVEDPHWNELSWEQKVAAVKSTALDLKEIRGATRAAQVFLDKLEKIQTRVAARPNGQPLPEDQSAIQALASQRSAAFIVSYWFIKNAPNNQIAHGPNDTDGNLGPKLSQTSPLQYEVLPTLQAYLQLPAFFPEQTAIDTAAELGRKYRKLGSDPLDLARKKQILRQMIAIRIRVHRDLPRLQLRDTHPTENLAGAIQNAMVAGPTGLILGAAAGRYLIPFDTELDILVHTFMGGAAGGLLGVVGIPVLGALKDGVLNGVRLYSNRRPVRRVTWVFLSEAGLSLTSCERALLKI